MDLKSIIAKLKKGESLTAEELAFLDGLKTISLDSVKDFLEKDEAGKKHLQSVIDAAVTKGINTFKEKTMPGLIEDEIKKKFPAETEEQKRIRQLEDDQKKLNADIKRKDLLNKAITLATDKKLPLKIVQHFLGEDEDTTVKNIELLETEYNNAVSAAVEIKFKENGRGGGGSGDNKPPKEETEYDKMSDAEFFKKRQEELNQKKK